MRSLSWTFVPFLFLASQASGQGLLDATYAAATDLVLQSGSRSQRVPAGTVFSQPQTSFTISGPRGGRRSDDGGHPGGFT